MAWPRRVSSFCVGIMSVQRSLQLGLYLCNCCVRVYVRMYVYVQECGVCLCCACKQGLCVGVHMCLFLCVLLCMRKKKEATTQAGLVCYYMCVCVCSYVCVCVCVCV
jgi:hypothetical protein